MVLVLIPLIVYAYYILYEVGGLISVQKRATIFMRKMGAFIRFLFMDEMKFLSRYGNV